MENTLGFAHFLSQTDAVGRGVLGFLALLSVLSWYLILTKTISNILDGRSSRAYLRLFWAANSLGEVRELAAKRPADNAFADLAEQALAATHGADGADQQQFDSAGGMPAFLTKVMRNGIDQESAHLGSGLTVLASAGSASPYIGLFGTVWGIYHALINIGLSGQGTLDKVSGPVGEALIMTAVGLAVAIPAVIALSVINRRNRVWLAQLDAFALDLYALILVGKKSNSSAGPNRVR